MKEYYRSKSSDELKALLRADAEAGAERALEPEEAWEVLEALSEKKQSPLYTPADTAWERFRRSYLEPMERRTAAETLPPSLRRRPPRRRPAWTRSVGGSNLKAAAAALVTVALISAASVSAYAAGADSRAAAPWEYETAESACCEFEYTNLQSALYFLGVSDLSAPKTLPEGFICTGAQTVGTRIRSVLLLRCSNGGAEITMSVAVSGEGVGSAFPKRNDALKKYIPDGNAPATYFVGDSGGSSEAYWKDGRYECALYGECPLAELEKMLSSIEKTPPYPADSGR